MAKPIPLPLINLVFSRVIKEIAHNRMEIFSRLTGHHHKAFLIDISNLPFVIFLRPNPNHSELKTYRRHNAPPAEAKISGSFLTLLGMIDGRYDGDALFFSRDLRVEGDTEAVVALRNALDDMDGSIAEDIASFFGKTGLFLLQTAREVSNHVYRT